MKIITTKKFDKQLHKQPQKVIREFKKRILVFLEDINHPTLKTHKLSGKLKDLWSFNINSDIRVIFDKSNKDVIILVSIGSHSELYK